MSWRHLGRLDLARLVVSGEVTKDEAGRELIERALRRLRKLEARAKREAESSSGEVPGG